MSSRIEKMLAKTQGIRAAKDIPEAEVVRSAAPKTAVGTMAAWRASQARIEELEKQLAAGKIEAMLPVAAIFPNPWQPRRVFDEAEIQKLAGSIAEIGLIQPVIVRCVGNTNTNVDSQKGVGNTNTTDANERSVGNANTTYQLVAGERRWRAHKLLGRQEIKAIVIEATDEEMASLALAENFDREDLTAYEIALAIRNTEAAFPNRKSLASALGINRSDLYDYLAYFSLPAFVVNDLEAEPGLLGRAAAKDIKVAIDKYGRKAEDALRHLWPRVKSGDLDQGKIASLIETSISRGSQAPIQRDIRKLFIGKEQAGSIMRDSGKLKIEIKASALTPEREAELRRFVEGMFRKEESQQPGT
ncbi:ParB/RepB/Spo0J family partition protein [Sulfuricystis multivorans]|uniref:ParB/RepB/Spo0J family partition protein n=1 Tax=Sulfuricystis multivorans TaxID=2211108 RepID=UPI000F82D247|nr:ParB/RepB/Spo0J family partition protein [Sulfuricystis multivorans]